MNSDADGFARACVRVSVYARVCVFVDTDLTVTGGNYNDYICVEADNDNTNNDDTVILK